MYNFNADLKWEHVRPEDRVALYIGKKQRDKTICCGAVMLVRVDYPTGRLVCVSFNEWLHCNNASDMPTEMAWDLFDEIRQDIKKQGEANGPSSA